MTANPNEYPEQVQESLCELREVENALIRLQTVILSTTPKGNPSGLMAATTEGNFDPPPNCR